MDIPLLADPAHKASKAYNVSGEIIFTCCQPWAFFPFKIHNSLQVLLEDGGVALRGMFIIDGEGILRQMTVNDLPVGRNVDEALRLVKAFQFTDVHGEVCPAGWNPGSDTMKPDPKGSKEYFNKAN